MNRFPAALVALLALMRPSGLLATQHADSAASSPLVNVPYVSQGERLCGGAAAAMLMRASGARGVYAEDFSALVDASAGGIHTKALAAAIRERGYEVEVSNGTSALAQHHLSAGRPVLALIEDRPSRYHYVVVVGWHAGTVVFHDPARAPSLARKEADFERAWRMTDHWMLVITRTSAELRIASNDGLEHHDRQVTSPMRATATERFVDRDYEEAARLASRAVAANPADRESWRILAASRYLTGDAAGALDAWNRAGDPTIDLVRIEGLSRTPHRTVEHLMGLAPGTVLTREAIARAERRLALLPAQQASRVSYIALPGNVAEVRGAIVERPLFPSRLEWIAAAARVGIEREAAMSSANIASAGDRLTAAWRFWEGRPRAGIDFRFPSRSIAGVWGLSAEWQEEHYADAAPSELRGARLTWTNWVTGNLRVSAGAGLSRWNGRGTAMLVELGTEVRPLADRIAVTLATDAAVGAADPFFTSSVGVRWQGPQAHEVRVLGSAAVSRASARAPLDRWPGAGSDPARPFLLRAHPLLHDGRIDGTVFGRMVTQSTIEAQRDLARKGFATIGVAAFTDVARAWERHDGSASPLHIDAGLGLRVRLAPGQPAIRVDLARGLRDGAMVFSVGWQR